MSDSVKKRWTCPEAVIAHIFDGEPKGGTYAGLHSEAVKSLENGKLRISGQPDPDQWQRRMNGEVYRLNVEVQINGKWYGPDKTTFFPHPTRQPHPNRRNDGEVDNRGARFTKDNIILWIEQALTRHKDSIRTLAEDWETDPRKIARTDSGGDVERIKINGVSCVVLYTDHTVASVFPSTLGARPE